MSIDPRLMERRKTVAEDNAKKSVNRLLKFLLIVVVAGALVWVAFSPWLSVARVDTVGVSASSAHTVLAESGVRAGTPMILIDPATVESRLAADPWIATATVSRDWPDLVTVTVEERAPVAWVRTSEGWSRHAIDGVALPSAEEPDPAMGWVEMSSLPTREGPESRELLGALEFIAALDTELQSGAVVRMQEDELWATVAGFEVRLGRADEMAEKALSLGALLEENLVEGSTLTLIAPTTPSCLGPETETSDEEEDPESADEDHTETSDEEDPDDANGGEGSDENADAES